MKQMVKNTGQSRTGINCQKMYIWNFRGLRDSSVVKSTDSLSKGFIKDLHTAGSS